jgi:hypothetical protein
VVGGGGREYLSLFSCILFPAFAVLVHSIALFRSFIYALPFPLCLFPSPCIWSNFLLFVPCLSCPVTADYIPRYLAVISLYICLGVIYSWLSCCDISCRVPVLSWAVVLHRMDGSQRSFIVDPRILPWCDCYFILSGRDFVLCFLLSHADVLHRIDTSRVTAVVRSVVVHPNIL